MAFDFNLEIVFTGICSLILDRPVESAASVSAVLPDSWDTKRKSDYKGIDDKDFLVRHGAMLQIPSGNVHPNGGGGVLVWYPKRHRVTFEFEGAEGARNDFSIDSSVSAHVANMAVIADKFPFVPKDLLGEDPPKEVLANVQFPQMRGKLSAIKGPLDWTFSGVLSKSGGDHHVDAMSYMVVLRLEKIGRVKITADPFGKLGSPRPGNPGSAEKAMFEIVGRKENEEVRVVIANSCDANPLAWGDGDSAYSGSDPDFKWHYECLCSKKGDVKTELSSKDLPYPARVLLAGRGRNCFPALWVSEI